MSEALDEIIHHPGLSAVMAEMAGATERRGSDFVGCCPFHAEHTPSFYVGKGLFYCHGACRSGGGAIELVMRLQQVTKGEAVRLLADRLQVRLPDSHHWNGHEPPQAPTITVEERRSELLYERCMMGLQRLVNRARAGESRERDDAACDVRDYLAMPECWSHLQWERFAEDMGVTDAVCLASSNLRRRSWTWPESWAGAEVPDAVGHALAMAQAYFASQPDWRALAAARGFTPETAAEWGMGYSPKTDGLLEHLLVERVDWADAEKAGLLASGAEDGALRARFYGRLTLPVHDASGALVAFAGRSLAAQPKSKYINSPSAPWYRRKTLFYGFHRAWQAIREARDVVLVEGYFDVMRLHANGETNAVGVMGAQVTAEQAKAIAKWDIGVTLCLDGDSAGVSGAMVSAVTLMQAGVWPRVVRLTGAKDPDEFLRYGPAERIADQPRVNLLDWLPPEVRQQLAESLTDPPVAYSLRTRLGLPMRSLGGFRLVEKA